MYTESQKKATEKYKKAHYKRIPLDVPVEFYNEIKEYCNANGYTVNGLIRELLKEKINNA